VIVAVHQAVEVFVLTVAARADLTALHPAVTIVVDPVVARRLGARRVLLAVLVDAIDVAVAVFVCTAGADLDAYGGRSSRVDGPQGGVTRGPASLPSPGAPSSADIPPSRSAASFETPVS
jgi:hypothetical protein